MRADPGRRRIRTISISVFVLLGAMLSLAWWLVHLQWQNSVQSHVEIAADQAAIRLQDFVQDRLFAVEALAQDFGRSDNDFESRALIVQQQFGGFQAINWIDAEGLIQRVTPREPNQGALGKNVLDHPTAHSAFGLTQESQQPHMTSALDLFQGGRGFATYYPVTRGNRTIAYLNGVFRIQPLVETALRGSLLEGYEIHIVDDTGALVMSSKLSPEARGDRPSTQAYAHFLDRTWTVEVWPKETLWEDMRSGRSSSIFIFIILLVAIIAWLIHLAMMRQLLHKEAEDERRELERQLDRAARLEAVGRLAGGIAHDFNNMLAAIINNAELIVPENDFNREARDDILDAADRASELTRQLLAFARRPSANSPEVVDINTHLEGLQRMLQRLLPGNIDLTLHLDPRQPNIHCVPSSLGQIVVNLVVNAADAMPHGGPLTLTTSTTRDNTVILKVQDRGTGMDAQTLEHLFEPFYTTKGEGTGLGLATVYGLVQSAGATMEVESTLGQGTTFTIAFPRCDITPSEDLPLVEPESGSPLEGRVLYVEDHDAVRRPLVRTLQAMGYEVVEARDGQEALEHLQEPNLTFDVIITDIVMPRLSGVELLAYVREHHPTLPVVLCSGHTQEPIDIDDDPHTVFLAKPFSTEQLNHALRSIRAPSNP